MNVEWGVGNGEWGVGNVEWGVGNAYGNLTKILTSTGKKNLKIEKHIAD
jgi:hypothetical protein